MSFTAPSLARLAVLALSAAACAAGAQQVYRIVGPDGRVTFSDKPPVDPTVRAAPAATVPLGGSGGSGTGGLPFELQQVASRFPVTLYSGPNCGPCNAGRDFLTSRGIPFSERTVSTPQDVAALGRLLGEGRALPVLTIGAQQLKGYSDVEWAQFLDAAGYPKSSQLPPGYRPPAPSPLVAVAPPQPARPAASAPSAAAAPTTPSAPALPAGNNPAGITF